MNFIIWAILGGIIGWVVSIAIEVDDQRATMLNIAVGIVGATLGGELISPLIDGGAIEPDNINLSALMDSIVGAEILLAVVNFVRRPSGSG